jgi:tetratricopeptide (TPR) repeat protein
VIAAVDQLTASLRQRVGESLESIRASSPLLKVTTSSLTALRKHSMAMSAFYEEDYLRSAALYEEAIAIDSLFADAYVGLVTALSRAGIRPARQIEAMTKAYRYRDRLGDGERYGIEGNYLARIKGDPESAISAFQNQARLEPRMTYWGGLASLLIQSRRYAEAERTLVEGLHHFSTPVMYFHLAHARHAQGNRTGARATLDSAAARFPNLPLFERARVEMAAAEGNHAIADSLAHASSVRRGGTYPLLHQALLDATRGKLPEGLSHLRVLRSQQLASGSIPASFETLITMQRLRLHVARDTTGATGDIDAALTRREFRAIDPRERPYVALANFFVRAGAPNRARELLQEYEAVVPGEFRVSDKALLARTRAMLEIESGRDAGFEALRIAAERNAFPHAALADLAWAYRRRGMRDSLAAVQKRYVTTVSLRRFEEDPYNLRDALTERAR